MYYFKEGDEVDMEVKYWTHDPPRIVRYERMLYVDSYIDEHIDKGMAEVMDAMLDSLKFFTEDGEALYFLRKDIVRAKVTGGRISEETKELKGI